MVVVKVVHTPGELPIPPRVTLVYFEISTCRVVVVLQNFAVVLWQGRKGGEGQRRARIFHSLLFVSIGH